MSTFEYFPTVYNMPVISLSHDFLSISTTIFRVSRKPGNLLISHPACITKYDSISKGSSFAKSNRNCVRTQENSWSKNWTFSKSRDMKFKQHSQITWITLHDFGICAGLLFLSTVVPTANRWTLVASLSFISPKWCFHIDCTNHWWHKNVTLILLRTMIWHKVGILWYTIHNNDTQQHIVMSNHNKPILVYSLLSMGLRLILGQLNSLLGPVWGVGRL